MSNDKKYSRAHRERKLQKEGRELPLSRRWLSTIEDPELREKMLAERRALRKATDARYYEQHKRRLNAERAERLRVARKGKPRKQRAKMTEEERREKKRARDRARRAAAAQRRREIAAAALMPAPQRERYIDTDTIAEFIRRNGVTRCPTKYVAPSEHGALDAAAAARRIAEMKPVDHSKGHWKARKAA